MHELITEIDAVLQDFITGDVKVENWDQYMALERIAVIVNKHRNSTKSTGNLEDYDFG